MQLLKILYIFLSQNSMRIFKYLISNFNQFSFYRRGQLWTPIYMNVTHVNKYTGKIFVGNHAYSNSFFYAVVSILYVFF